MAKYDLKRSGAQFMLNLKAANGEVVLTSERYASKQGTFNGIDSVRANSPTDSRYDRRSNSTGPPYFNLKASNGEIIGTSEPYASTTGRDNAIEWLKTKAPSAATDDNT